MRRSKWTALSLLATTQFVLILDQTIVGIALPALGRELGLTAAGLAWTTTAYTLAFGGLLLLGGRLADTLGRRLVFATGMALFALASLAGGLAAGGELVIAARAVQGMAGALVAPAALSLVMTIFKDDPDLGRALGSWGAVGAVGGASGVVLGGLLTDWFGWRAVFFVNVPVGLSVALLAFALLPEARAAGTRRGFDVAGALTSTAGLSLLTYALVDAGENGWTSPRVVLLGAAALVLLAAFVRVEARSADPLLPLAVFRRPLLRAGNLLSFLVPAAMQPLFFILTLYTQMLLGYSPTESGLSIAAIAVAIAITASTLGGRALERYGVRATAAVGTAFMAGGAALYLRIPVDGSFLAHLLVPELLTGFGFGLFVVAATVAATIDAAPAEAGLASGLVNVSQQTGISVGMALIVTVAAAVTGDSARPADLLAGYHAAILASVAIAGLALVASLLLLPEKKAVPVSEPAQT